LPSTSTKSVPIGMLIPAQYESDCVIEPLA
jgi:hypothetical protein